MRKLSIIYDTTRLCPWNCPICCMGASLDPACCSDELTLAQKLDLVNQIKTLNQNGYDVSVDVSGGEIFSTGKIDEHKELLLKLNEAIGQEKLGVSCSGYNITSELAEFLARTVRDVEMTMDTVPHREYVLRPYEYSNAAAKAVHKLKAAGCRVGLQTVASTYNYTYEDALAVFAWACANKVDNWSILRYFASGRGANHPEAAMTDEQCAKYVKMVQQMVSQSQATNKPKVDFHYLMPGHEKFTEVCRCVRHSIGILPNGAVLSCFWSMDDAGKSTVDPKFLLGNVKEQTLLEILDSPQAHYWSDCEHCCELGASSTNERSDNHVVLSA